MNFQNIQRNIKDDNVSFFKNCREPDQMLNFRHDKSGDTVLHMACKFGSIRILEHFVSELKAEIEASNKDGKRPLHEAAQYSQEKCCQTLLENKAQIDPLKRADWTPLMLACTKEALEIVKMLLDAGADPHLKNKDGWNSFHIASREGHLPILKTLLEHAPGVWDTKSKNLRTPLHTAALHGHVKVVQWMLQVCQYVVDTQDTCGITPLMDALRAGHTEVAQILTDQHQADVTLEDKAGRQAIHQVAQAGQMAAFEMIINKAQMSVNVKSALSGETPLHMAAKEGHTQMTELILRLGADVDAVDKRGRTALHVAAMGQHKNSVTALLKHGAKIVKDTDGHFPAHYARKVDVVSVFGDVT